MVMDADAVVAAFPFDQPGVPVSLYRYAPVLRVPDRHGDWVVKRTGAVHSDGVAIACWLTALHAAGVAVVVPPERFSPNPRTLADGAQWVVYPFVAGTDYAGRADQIAAAGSLLGQMHAVDGPAIHGLATYRSPVVRPAEWIAVHAKTACAAMRDHRIDPARFAGAVAGRAGRAAAIDGLPLAGCSFDFKASNLVFAPAPTLVDPDHAARMPRLFDLAIALLLFHCDLSSAPGRVWTAAEWGMFLSGYRRWVTPTAAETVHWPAVLALAWLDQAVWLLGNWPEGWADPKDRAYMTDLAACDLDAFRLDAPP